MKPDNTATRQREAQDADFQVLEAAQQPATPAIRPSDLRVANAAGNPRRIARRTKPKGNYLSPRVRRAIDTMIATGCTRAEAANSAGIKDNWLAWAMHMPAVATYYTEQLQVLRFGLRARGLHTVADLAGNAASENVKLQAAKYLDSEGKSEGTVINVGVQVNNQPGYMVDLGQQAERMHQIARQAGSSRTVLEPDE